MNKANILLVDDQPGKLLSYETMLTDLGENLVTARSGREALQCLLREEFALILLDVVMPEMDGFETATLIRQRPKLKHTPIIFLTSYSTSDLDRLKGYSLGAVDYVFAPVVPEILRAKVQVFVELYRSRWELAVANELILAEIADRKRAEESLRKAEERLRILIEGVHDYAIYMLDPNGVVTSWNEGAKRITGYEADEIVGEHFSRFYTQEGIQAGGPDREIRQAAEEGRFEEEGWRIRKDGSLFWANVIVTVLRDSEGRLRGFSKVVRDLTERKQTEEKLRQNERLAAIGQMVAGLAHESRNALQQIQACVEMLSRRLKSTPEAALIVEIQRAHDRLHHLFEDVRGYAAPMNLACEVRSLSELWHEAWTQLAPDRQGRDARLHEEHGGVDLRCSVDPFSIERLFRNILDNSLAACTDPVRIDVQCTAAELQGQSAVRICIADNGPGLSDEARQRVFEPFFTTKTTGTGLGMAIARRIAEAHGGRIAVANGAAHGTAIEVLLPKGRA